ncbi:hypothetical protein [Terriglobus albidus]|uniref:hypothetical protein n=1 Tax=Terriglobus albidus TaxID=1592106 RepID=UPI0021E0B5F0|nr:hypothetical protein [Terriglobus albidus]
MDGKKVKVRMDILVAKEIDITAVPDTTPTAQRAPQGRLGELLERLKGLALKKALEVQCRDIHHIRQTKRAIQKSAKRVGMQIDCRQGVKALYVWKTAEWKEAR